LSLKLMKSEDNVYMTHTIEIEEVVPNTLLI
jgi:hypothetical protein